MREGAKGLVRMGAPLRKGDALYCEQVEPLSGRRYVLSGSALAPMLVGGGLGGILEHVLPGEGAQDATDPWENPPGDLVVRLYYEGVPPAEWTAHSCVRPRPLLLLGGGDGGEVAAAAAGGIAGAALRERAEAEEMRGEAAAAAAAAAAAEAMAQAAASADAAAAALEAGAANAKGDKTQLKALQAARGEAREASVRARQRWQHCASLAAARASGRWDAAARPTGLCLVFGDRPSPSLSAAACMAGMAAGHPTLRWRCVRVPLGDDVAPAEALADDEWAALGCASAVVLDMDLDTGLGKDLDTGLGMDLDTGLGKDLDTGLDMDLNTGLGTHQRGGTGLGTGLDAGGRREGSLAPAGPPQSVQAQPTGAAAAPGAADGGADVEDAEEGLLTAKEAAVRRAHTRCYDCGIAEARCAGASPVALLTYAASSLRRTAVRLASAADSRTCCMWPAGVLPLMREGQSLQRCGLG